MARKPGQNATSYGCKGFRTLRSWTTLLLLAEPGTPPTAAEITERLRCRYPFDGLELSLQTTRDDLRLLRQADFPAVPVDDHGAEIDLDAFESLSGKLKNPRWTLRNPTKLPELLGEGLPRPSAADVLVLDLLRSLLRHTHPAGFWLAATTRRLLDEVAHLLDARPRSPRHSPAGTVTVRLRVADDLATRIRPCPIYAECATRFPALNKDATERLLLSLGSGAVVESPPDLRRRIALHHRQRPLRARPRTAGSPFRKPRPSIPREKEMNLASKPRSRLTLRAILALLPLLAVLLLVGCEGSTKEHHHVFPEAYYGESGESRNSTPESKKRADASNVRLDITNRYFMDYAGPESSNRSDSRNAFGPADNQIEFERLWDGSDFTPYAQRKMAIALGSRSVEYPIFLYHNRRDKDGEPQISWREGWKPKILLASEFDGVSNILFNVSYITATPSKFVHYTRFAWNKYGLWDFLKAEVWMIFHLALGLVLALVMIFLGTAVGTVLNPIDTLANLTVSPSNWMDTNLLCTLWDLARAVFEPLFRILWWSPGYGLETVVVGVVVFLFVGGAAKEAA